MLESRQRVTGRNNQQTPGSAARLFLHHQPLIGPVWEPASGGGRLAKVISEGYQTYSTDLSRGQDFLTYRPKFQFNSIVTNPPYNRADEFVARALEYDVTYVAMLLRLLYIESPARKPLLKHLSTVWIYRPRVWMVDDTREWGGMMCFAWFVWTPRRRPAAPKMRFLDRDQ